MCQHWSNQCHEKYEELHWRDFECGNVDPFNVMLRDLH
uniref:Uncharacterized protein n=1 Tax=viral metagenome TaxID=1070528 RepID=A0A6C0C8N6_9ZZZZ